MLSAARNLRPLKGKGHYKETQVSYTNEKLLLKRTKYAKLEQEGEQDISKKQEIRDARTA